ncbi:FAD binding domain-containing protein [Nocardiopsis composta]|uniref:Carbon-monoxide dehydrogenase medium subunit n=1 Tax=Nocardiopsis composta TaxID=157465 RepID=A0A7W8QM41_9ACTN|nr:xanthine dehydrogenase family protein subunit M [Nocardiopsis composta]MBB5432988.1 carbon-monoxide dehydrogenase medium subunit [Nocardiopsis composta]
MIPPRFDYLRPRTVPEAVDALAADEDAKALAGGQSLVPLLRFRLAAPTTVVDLGGVSGLRGVHDEGESLLIGAMTSHYEVIRDPLVQAHCGLLAQAARTVADPAVRHRGTLGGALAHADPAGDLPSVAMALDAEFLLTGPDGERTVPAAEFFVDYLTTAMEPGEVLTGVRFPKYDGWSFHYEKFSRTAQAWAITGVAAAVRPQGGGIAEARIGLTNMGPVPMRARAAEEACRGVPAQAEAVHDAAERADEGTDPPSDLNAQADYRRHLARVLTGRALLAAAT